MQHAGPSHTSAPLRTLAEAAAMQRANQGRGIVPAGPSTTRKRPAGVAQLTTPPKKRAMRREAQQEDAHQEEEVQLPSQLSQQTAASQPLNAIDNTSGFVAGRRTVRPGAGSRMADFIRRLS
ncbi:hypothetical protein AAVH_36576 [Aphelenchoides avenae]|nr:hypothetical protein AAVH_36576 [Aphelenchus avenae]